MMEGRYDQPFARTVRFSRNSKAAEWGVGASLLTSSARAIHFIFLLLALMYLDHLGHNGKKLVLLLALLWTSDSCCPFLLLDLGPSVGGWAALFFFTRQHIQHRYCWYVVKVDSVLRTPYSPEARIALVNIKLPRRVFNLITEYGVLFCISPLASYIGKGHVLIQV